MHTSPCSRRRRLRALVGPLAGAALLALPALGVGAAGLSPAATGAAAHPPAAMPSAIVRRASGPDAASIQAAVDRFRADLGGANNGVGGTFPGGRREINWDGVPDAASAPANLPADFFNVNSPRGVLMLTPGTGFQVSANATNPTGTAVEFGNINSGYPATFSVFSAQRLFTGLGSPVVGVSFFVPHTPTPALVKGFGAVFTDVDTADGATIEYFDAQGHSLGTLAAPAGPSGGLSFVGASTRGYPRIARVLITSGTAALGATTDDGAGTGAGRTDLVVMDDFIYGEPQALP
jgi:hypothetical protein